MKKNICLKLFIFLMLCFTFITISFNIPYKLLVICKNNMYVTDSELNSLLLKDNYFMSSQIACVNAKVDDNIDEYIVNYKLFNTFTIKKLKVNVLEKAVYYACGDCIGIALKSRGLYLMGGNYILTKDGLKTPLKDSDLKIGDLITHINNVEIINVLDIKSALNNYVGIDGVKVNYKRNGQKFETTIYPALDIQSNEYKLGLWVKDDALGLGTLTFINATTKRFGALGHSVNGDEQPLDVVSGEMYDARVLGIKPGKSGHAGEIIGTFAKDNPIGSVDKNCIYGVYGNIYNVDVFLNKKSPIELGGRLSANPGRATILCSLDGINIDEYDIEIIKTNYQNAPNEKSLVLRVIDNDLIEKTGGIIQGMSGSPIIQNGKLIGAVTHVFVNDATKGFGLYIDWMINE